MAGLLVARGHPADALRQSLHRPERLVVRELLRGERPEVAERHRPGTFGRTAARGMRNAAHVQNRDAVGLAPAELVRGAIAELLETVGDVVDEYAGGAVRG